MKKAMLYCLDKCIDNLVADSEAILRCYLNIKKVADKGDRQNG